jgi:hypothetical protein
MRTESVLKILSFPFQPEQHEIYAKYKIRFEMLGQN